MSHLNSSLKAYAAALSFAVIIGLSFLFTKISLGYADPLTVLAHRYSAGMLALLILQLTGRMKVRLSKKDVMSILPLSLFYPILFFSFQTFALQYISSSEAGIVQALLPVFTLVLASLFLGERTSIPQKLFLLLSVLGVIYIFVNKGIDLAAGGSTLGLTFMFISVFSNAGYNVLAKYKGNHYRPIDLTFVMIAVGCIVFNALSLARGLSSGDIKHYFEPLQHGSYLIAVLYLGLLASIVTATLSVYAMVRLGASKVSVFGNFSTVLTIFFGAIVLHESIHFYHIIGAAVIIIGVVGMTISKSTAVPNNRK